MTRLTASQCETMQQAIDYRREHGGSVYAVAMRFHLPESTLRLWEKEPERQAAPVRRELVIADDPPRVGPNLSWETRREIAEDVEKAWRNFMGAIILGGVRDTKNHFRAIRREAWSFLGGRWCERLRHGSGISEEAWHRIITALEDREFRLPNVRVAKAERKRKGET